MSSTCVRVISNEGGTPGPLPTFTTTRNHNSTMTVSELEFFRRSYLGPRYPVKSTRVTFSGQLQQKYEKGRKDEGAGKGGRRGNFRIVNSEKYCNRHLLKSTVLKLVLSFPLLCPDFAVYCGRYVSFIN